MAARCNTAQSSGVVSVMNQKENDPRTARDGRIVTGSGGKHRVRTSQAVETKSSNSRVGQKSEGVEKNKGNARLAPPAAMKTEEAPTRWMVRPDRRLLQ